MGIVGPLLLTLATATVQGITLKDVPSDHWARPSIERVLQDSGQTYCGELKFEGERTITRFQMAVLVAHVLDKAGTSQAASMDESELRKALTHLTASMESLRQSLSTLRTRVDALAERIRLSKAAVTARPAPRR